MGLGRGGRSPSSEGFSLPSPISKSFPFLQASQLLAGGAGGTDIGHGLDLNLTARVGERKLGAVLQRAVHADKTADKAFGRETFRLFGLATLVITPSTRPMDTSATQVSTSPMTSPSSRTCGCVS